MSELKNGRITGPFYYRPISNLRVWKIILEIIMAFLIFWVTSGCRVLF